MDVRELARLFVYDPLACETFIGKIIDTVDMDSNGALRSDKIFSFFTIFFYEKKLSMQSFPEFLMLMCKTEGIDGVKAAFQSYDTDGSGTITLVELAKWMKRHGKTMTEDELGKLVDAFV